MLHDRDRAESSKQQGQAEILLEEAPWALAFQRVTASTAAPDFANSLVVPYFFPEATTQRHPATASASPRACAMLAA